MTEEKIENCEHEHNHDCGCEEHEHEHHHHDGCCEEHDHEHHHDCGCEEHEHEHHHHDGCCEEHEHEHHHHHHEDGCQCEDCVSGVSVIHQDGALAGSFAVDTDEEIPQLEETIKNSMNKLKEMIDKKGGVIGHIKAAVSCGEDSVMYSLTFEEINKIGEFGCDAKADKVSFASIIYGLEEDELRAFLVDLKEHLE